MEVKFARWPVPQFCFHCCLQKFSRFVNDGSDCATHCSLIYLDFGFTMKQGVVSPVTSRTLKFNDIMRESAMNFGR